MKTIYASLRKSPSPLGTFEDNQGRLFVYTLAETEERWTVMVCKLSEDGNQWGFMTIDCDNPHDPDNIQCGGVWDDKTWGAQTDLRMVLDQMEQNPGGHFQYATAELTVFVGERV